MYHLCTIFVPCPLDKSRLCARPWRLFFIKNFGRPLTYTVSPYTMEP
nr:MAG TPA: hypothetical protein [Caudoviricetes sp.]